jgi:hypothetical protein
MSRLDIGSDVMFIRRAIAVLLLAAATSSAGAKCTGTGAHDEGSLREICELERAWGESLVKGDPSVAKKMLADDFAGIDTGGKPYRKADEVAYAGRVPHIAKDTLNDVTVHFFGNTAVAQGSDSWVGKDGRRGRFVWTDVWLRRKDEWQVVAAEDLIAPAVRR